MEVTSCSNTEWRKFLNNVFAIACGEVFMIVRVHLRRSIKSHITPMSTIKLEVALTSEFFGRENYLEADCRLMGLFIKSDSSFSTVSLLQEINECAIVFPLKSDIGHLSHYTIAAPDEVGAYHLFIFPYETDPSESIFKKRFIILPLLTDCFNVVSKDHAAMTQFIPSLLSCYRVIHGIIIEEEYGKTVGSHVYDCSIAILRYLASSHTVDGMTGSNVRSCSSNTPDRMTVAVELGAGCGLVSIWLAKRNKFNSVIATDMDNQLPLILRNIERNNVQPVCSSKELNWSLTVGSGRKDLESSQFSFKLQREYLGMHDDEHLDMIIAGDVMYSKSLTEDFITVLRALAVPYVTVIYLAQKLRNADRKDSYDIASTPGIRCECVWEEADVLIWKIFVVD
jgi:predicted nicotinamide N-methyase